MRNIIFTFVFAAICSISAFAEAGYYYGEAQNGQIFFYHEDDNGECTLLNPWWCYNNLSGYEDILSQYGHSASNYYYIGDFVIPDYINVIGYEAFVAIIEDDDYIVNEGLTSVTITNSVTSIDTAAFEDCGRLTSVTIPNSVTSIMPRTFSGCYNLRTIEIPNSVTSIGSSAFYGCSGLTSVTIPNSVTSIGGSAFEGCSSLASITMPGSITSIKSATFAGCEALTSITIPNSVTNIGYEAFSGCSGLTSVTIGTGVTEIRGSAFYRCRNLSTVYFNATNCTTMGNSDEPVFEHCSSLVTLNIGENVVIIPENAFKSCTSFTSIVSAANNPPAIYTSSFDSSLSPMTPVTVPCGSVADYERYWPYFRNIQDDCSYIEDSEFENLQIFPNPTNNILNISSSETISEIEIVNTLGQVVKRIEVNSDNAVCNVEELKAGIYIVRIHGTGICQQKFIKE